LNDTRRRAAEGESGPGLGSVYRTTQNQQGSSVNIAIEHYRPRRWPAYLWGWHVNFGLSLSKDNLVLAPEQGWKPA